MAKSTYVGSVGLCPAIKSQTHATKLCDKVAGVTSVLSGRRC